MKRGVAFFERGNVIRRADEAVDYEETALKRFATLFDRIVEARRLRESDSAKIKAQFERLWKGE